MKLTIGVHVFVIFFFLVCNSGVEIAAESSLDLDVGLFLARELFHFLGEYLLDLKIVYNSN